MNTCLLRTALYETHVDQKARLVPFAGWEMPVQYAGVLAEVNAVRTGCGLFDVSHMGRLRITGPDAIAFISKIVVSNPQGLGDGRGQYSLMCNEAGGIIDDIIVYRMSENDWRIVYNAGCLEKDRAWFQAHSTGFRIALDDESDRTGLIAVQGPRAIEILGETVAGLPRFGIGPAIAGGVEVLAARTGYTGEDGAELFVSNEKLSAVWEHLVRAGAVPCGLGARDTLRVEAALPLYGHEMDENIDPFRARLGWVVKLDRPDDFMGRSALSALKKSRREVLVGVQVEGRGIPREGYPIQAVDGSPIGQVTSGTFSPTLSKGIALARVRSGSVAVGDPVDVLIRDTPHRAVVAPLPFVKNV